MEKQTEAFKVHVKELAASTRFVHNRWFVKWHLEIVERIALELCDHYPQANRDLVVILAWLHDYGKLLDFDGQYGRELLDKGRDKLVELGFAKEFANKAADYVALVDKKTELDLHQAPIEAQIIASADGCSHLVGPFIRLWWWEHPDQPFKEIMAENIRKLGVDWDRKVVLPEARAAFQTRHDVAIEQSGKLPTRFLF